MNVFKLKCALASSVFISLITTGIGNAIADEAHGLKKGQDAINFLGEDKIKQKAAKSGMKPEQFKKQLLKDKSMHVDDQGEVVFIDEPSSNAATLTTNSISNTTIVGPSIPSLDNYTPDQAFTLHSKPVSNRTIYLRFIGADLTNTAWSGGQTLIMPPYDFDGNPAYLVMQNGKISFKYGNEYLKIMRLLMLTLLPNYQQTTPFQEQLSMIVLMAPMQ